MAERLENTGWFPWEWCDVFRVGVRTKYHNGWVHVLVYTGYGSKRDNHIHLKRDADVRNSAWLVCSVKEDGRYLANRGRMIEEINSVIAHVDYRLEM